jgi:ketosteroid isomerase-like protein
MGAIVAANVAWGDAYVRGDGAGLASLYAEDARLMTEAGDVTGPSAIREWLLSRRAGADSVRGTATTTDQLDVAGDRAYEAGTLTYSLVAGTPAGSTRELRVRYSNFWQRQPDGRWLIVRSLRPVP